MKTVKTVCTQQTETIDPNIPRGVTYNGLDCNGLQQKLPGSFSIAMASAFPLYQWFMQHGDHQVDGYYYEPPDDLAARKEATLDKSIGHLLLQHLPGWAGLPDKETSATVYSGRMTANEFSKRSHEEGNYPGRMYRAVPALNSRLVIAPANHIRYSFSYALGAFGIADAEYGSLGKLSGCFRDLLRAYGMADEFPRDWPLFLATLQDITCQRIQPARKLSTDTEKLFVTLVDNKEQLVDFLDNAFSPLQNGFTVIDYTDGLNKEDYPDNEIWMASPCLLIEEELFERMESY